MAKYAYKNTDVPGERSIGKIKDLLYKHGAVAIQYTEVRELQMVQFVFSRRFKVGGEEKQQPVKIDVKYGGRKVEEALRMVYYHLKAKFDAVDWGLYSFEQEFLPWMVVRLPSGKDGTVAEAMLPDVKRGQLPEFFDPLWKDKKQLTEGGR